MRENFGVLLAALTKPETGINGDPITVDTGTARAVNRRFQIARYRPNHIRQRRQFRPVSGVPRMWLRIRPTFAFAAVFARSASKVRPLGSLTISMPYSNARSAVSALWYRAKSE